MAWFDDVINSIRSFFSGSPSQPQQPAPPAAAPLPANAPAWAGAAREQAVNPRGVSQTTRQSEQAYAPSLPAGAPNWAGAARAQALDKQWSAQDQQRQQQRTADSENEDMRLGRSNWNSGTRQLSQQEYDALDPTARAAVDFNGMLAAALEKDKALDTDKNGKVSAVEAGMTGDKLQKFTEAYKKVYHADPDAETDYTPNTIGLLNRVGFDDEGGQSNEFLSGTGYVTMDDITKGRTKGAIQGPPVDGRQPDYRGSLVSKLAGGMGQLEKSLAGGTKFGGVPVQLSFSSITPEQRSAMVDGIRASLFGEEVKDKFTLSGDEKTLGLANGMDVLQMISPEQRSRIYEMNAAFSQLAAGDANHVPATQEQLSDPKWLRSIGFDSMGFDMNEWLAMAAEKGAKAQRAPANEGDMLKSLLEDGGKK